MNEEKALCKLVEVLRRAHYGLSTERCYVGWVRRYVGWLRKVRPVGSSEEKFAGWLTMLAKEGVSASTQNQAFNAVVFFYRHVLEAPLGNVKALRARRGARERTAPTRGQVRELLRLVEDVHGYPTRLIVFLLYGCGLRVSEPLNLRIKDLDFENGAIMVREGKRNKDRVVRMPRTLMRPLWDQVQRARLVWQADRAAGVPVPLPGLLARKYPRAPFSWQWFWLFPSAKPCRHPRTGETVRWRVHEANVQKAVRFAAQKLDFDGVITPHNLRHSYATHLLDAGVKMTAVAEAMGHESIETTAGYDHSEPLSVPSPMDIPRLAGPVPGPARVGLVEPVAALLEV